MTQNYVPTGAVPIILNVEARTHGRVLVLDPPEAPAAGTLVAFHGYGQSAEEALADVMLIPGADRWRVVAVQALNRFYARDERVVANWMTRQDRADAIADNIEYVDRAIEGAGGALRQPTPGPLVFVGFSQGVAMAYRAAVRGRPHASGVIALAGDIPPELTEPDAVHDRPWPPVLIGVGSRETWYSPEKVDADVRFLESCGAAHEVCRFEGGHEWTPAFRAAAGDWLARARIHSAARSSARSSSVPPGSSRFVAPSE